MARGYGPAGGRRARSTGGGTACGGRGSPVGARGAKAPRPRRHSSTTGAIDRLDVEQPGRLPALAAGGRVTVALAGRRVTCRGRTMIWHTAGGETATVDLPAEWDGEVAFVVDVWCYSAPD